MFLCAGPQLVHSWVGLLPVLLLPATDTTGSEGIYNTSWTGFAASFSAHGRGHVWWHDQFVLHSDGRNPFWRHNHRENVTVLKWHIKRKEELAASVSWSLRDSMETLMAASAPNTSASSIRTPLSISRLGQRFFFLLYTSTDHWSWEHYINWMQWLHFLTYQRVLPRRFADFLCFLASSKTAGFKTEAESPNDWRTLLENTFTIFGHCDFFFFFWLCWTNSGKCSLRLDKSSLRFNQKDFTTDL